MPVEARWREYGASAAPAGPTVPTVFQPVPAPPTYLLTQTVVGGPCVRGQRWGEGVAELAQAELQ